MKLNRKHNSSFVFFSSSAEGGSKSALDQWKTPVTIKSDGNCSWMAPGVVKTSCKLNVRYFPFDEQVKLFFSSYTTRSYKELLRLMFVLSSIQSGQLRTRQTTKTFCYDINFENFNSLFKTLLFVF